MALHQTLGAAGEQYVYEYLITQGFIVRETNWRMGHLEVDIIAERNGTFHFVEVKTRSNEDFMPAQFAVTPHQQRNLLAATRMFLADHGLQEQPYRFDLITVVGTERPFEITHYKRVFRKPENHWSF